MRNLIFWQHVAKYLYSSSGTRHCVVAVHSLRRFEGLACLHLQLKAVQAESKEHTHTHTHTSIQPHILEELHLQ